MTNTGAVVGDHLILTKPIGTGVVANALELPFPENSFDVIFAIYILEHIDEPSQFVAQVRKVLKPFKEISIDRMIKTLMY